MRIAVDAACMEVEQPTGVELAAAALIDALGHVLEPDDRLLVFGRTLARYANERDGQVSFHRVGGRTPTALWRETHLVSALSRSDVDVLWSPVTAIPLRCELPRVATVHELPWAVREGLEGRVREATHRARLRETVRRAARVVCPSEATRSTLVAEFEAARPKARVVRHGVGERWLRDVTNARGTYFLHVGGDRPRKDLPLLFDAYASYREAGGRLPLVLIGPGAAPRGLPPGAEFRGYVPDDTLLATYDGARAVLVSSESEGFGLPVLEAFARGRPVVTVAQAALEETAAGAALLVDRGDAAAFGAALGRLGEDDELWRSLHDRGLQRAARSTWRNAAGELLCVLREAVAPS